MLVNMLIVTLLSMVDPPPSKLDDALEARWRREYPRASAEHESTLREFLAKGRMSVHYVSGKELTVGSLTVAQSGGKRLTVQEKRMFNSSLRPNLVECRTPQVEFTLEQNAGKNSYSITTFKTNNTQENAKIFDYEFFTISYCAIFYLGPFFKDKMVDSSFVLKSIESVKSEGREIIHLGYEYDGPTAWESGVVELAPDLNWAVRKVDLQTRGKQGYTPQELHVTVDYQEFPGPRFFPRRFDGRVVLPATGGYQRRIVEYDEIQLGDVPEEIFKLTAYGLPEIPDRPAPKRSVFTWSNPFLWLTFLAAVVCFTLLWKTRTRADRAA